LSDASLRFSILFRERRKFSFEMNLMCEVFFAEEEEKVEEGEWEKER
jgi:hypothetical protein